MTRPIQKDRVAPMSSPPRRRDARSSVRAGLGARLLAPQAATIERHHRCRERGCSRQHQRTQCVPLSNETDHGDEIEHVHLGEGRCLAVRPPTCGSVAQGATLKSLHPGNPLLWIRALELQVIAHLWMRKDEETLIDDRLIDDFGYVGRFEHLAD